MELVEGETLADRIALGPIALDEALPIARQICEALEAAHEHGIIHRDLKPANIKVRSDGTVKVLDFGLAEALDAAPTSSLSISPTITSPAMMTGAGVLLGTAAYMSPEQARGKAADKRADIWAFGCVLFEMLTGTRPFAGDDITDVIVTSLTKEPEWTKLPPSTPPRLLDVLQRCLRKDSRERLRDIGDARLELLESLDDRPLARGYTTRNWTPWVAALVLAAILIPTAAVAVRYWRETTTTGAVIRFQVPTPRMRGDGLLSASPDGVHMAYVAPNPDGRPLLWIRALDSQQAVSVPGSEGASWPCWSPDGRFVAFEAAHKLKTSPISGGPGQYVCDVAGTFGGGTWNRQGTILFAEEGKGLVMCDSTAGAVPKTALRLPPALGSAYVMSPQFLPDGDHFVCFTWTGDPRTRGIYIGSLRTGEIALVRAGDSLAAVAAGNLLFVREGTLFAQPIDPSTGKLSGDANPLVDHVDYDPVWGLTNVAASSTGLLVYRSGGARNGQLVWFDRTGARQMSVGDPAMIDNFDLSPDGARVLVAEPDSQAGGTSIWMIDERRGSKTKVAPTRPGEALDDPVWSPDGLALAFTARQPRAVVLRQPLNGGERVTLRPADEQRNVFMEDWSREGRYVAAGVVDAGTVTIAVLPLTGDRAFIPIAKAPIADEPHFSPDSKWIAYNSNESGTMEVFVSAVMPSGERWQISTKGGGQPR